MFQSNAAPVPRSDPAVWLGRVKLATEESINLALGESIKIIALVQTVLGRDTTGQTTMSRPAASRNLTLTEELERLEQQITLTLQEIDSNFSKAHRIVTSSILPIVDQYAKHSADVWDGSKFWKQFFEASANVSLSGYEEGALDEDATQHTETDETVTGLETPESARQRVSAGHAQDDEDESFTVDSPTQVTGVQSTPKLKGSVNRSHGGSSRPASAKAASFRSPSPRKYTGKNPLALSQQEADEPSTPTANISSPFQPESALQQPSTAQRASSRKNNADLLLHRNVLDKNYRVQATPHTQRRERQQQSRPMTTTTPGTATTNTTRKPWDDSPGSSPEISAPQLRSDLFSPQRKPQPHTQGPRTPGLSVLTPAGKPQYSAAATTSTGRQLFSPEDNARYTSRTSNAFSTAQDSDSDDDGFAMSPPKTMQFHVPQSRLLQTPAREASRKIVEDLLKSAGADATDEIEYEDERAEAPSPSVVRRGFEEDDTF